MTSSTRFQEVPVVLVEVVLGGVEVGVVVVVVVVVVEVVVVVVENSRSSSGCSRGGRSGCGASRGEEVASLTG